MDGSKHSKTEIPRALILKKSCKKVFFFKKRMMLIFSNKENGEMVTLLAEMERGWI